MHTEMYNIIMISAFRIHLYFYSTPNRLSYSNQDLWCSDHHACLSSWEILGRTSTQGLKIIEEKLLPLH